MLFIPLLAACSQTGTTSESSNTEDIKNLGMEEALEELNLVDE